MTARDCYPGLTLHRKSRSRRLADTARVGLALGLALLLVSCSSELAAPFVQLAVTGLPDTTVQLDVDVMLGTVTKLPSSRFLGDPNTLAQVTVSFAAGARGTLILTASARSASTCVLATGTATVELVANQVYPVTMVLLPTGNCQPGKVPLTVVKSGDDGLATVTSAGGEISCGKQCLGQFAPTAMVTLTAAISAAPAGTSYKFVGWSIASCGMASTCAVTPAQTPTVTVTYRCSGYCPETLPTQNGTLYGVWGFNTQKIVAVGANGTILQSDGATWKAVSSGVATAISLRAIGSAPGSQVGFVVGDGGTIIKTNDAGGTWSKLTSTVTSPLRSVVAASDNVAYALGDNFGMNNPFLNTTNGSTWAMVAIGGFDQNWNGAALVSPTQFLAVAAQSRSALIDFNTPSTNPIILMNTSTANLNGGWALSKTKMYAVGDASTLVQSTGGNFSIMAAPVTGVNLHAVYGFGATAIYAVGDRGNVWKCNGTTWSVVQSGGATMDLYGIWGNTETDFYIVGQNGTIIHNRP